MKKTIALLLVAVMALSLVACTQKTPATENPDNSNTVERPMHPKRPTFPRPNR